MPPFTPFRIFSYYFDIDACLAIEYKMKTKLEFTDEQNTENGAYPHCSIV